LTFPAQFRYIIAMKALIKTGSSRRVPVPPSKRFLIHPTHTGACRKDNVVIDLNDSGLLARLHEDILTNPDAERALTGARRELCLDPPPSATPLTVALAVQGSLNEYAWPVTATEAAALVTAPAWVRAMYESSEPDLERLDRGRRIPSLTAVATESSAAVQHMYEENPYPRWHRLGPATPQELGQILHELTGRAFEPPGFIRRPRLLVAGCGTGREMLSAAKAWQPASITGFDLSRTSLAYAQRMADRLGFDVELYQADLLELGDWDRRFDVIVCTGVLHHLEDPLLGWRILARLLRPGGVMLVGLYSSTARAGVKVAQALVRESGLPPTPDGLRRARALVMDLPPGHPGRNCTRMGDFYSLSGTRDMLFHIQERTFTMPDVAAALEDVGLEFLGFHSGEAARRLYRTLFGLQQRLAWWDTLEQLYPRMFLGMYQFWCRMPDLHQMSGAQTLRPPERKEINNENI